MAKKKIGKTDAEVKNLAQQVEEVRSISDLQEQALAVDFVIGGT